MRPVSVGSASSAGIITIATLAKGDLAAEFQALRLNSVSFRGLSSGAIGNRFARHAKTRHPGISEDLKTARRFAWLFLILTILIG